MKDDLKFKLKETVESLGYQLWWARWHNNKGAKLMQIFIENDKGITVDDCALVSKHLSVYLDVLDPTNESYSLEVSSPGLDRILMDKEHFEIYIGHVCKLKLKDAINDRRKISGKIVNTDNQLLITDAQGEHYKIDYSNIDFGRLVINLKDKHE